MRDLFSKLATGAARVLGSPYAFAIAFFIIIGWAIAGPMAGFSETWQLVINTATTIITFLSVFLIQNAQNRESMAMQLKLDEILYSLKSARNKLIDVEDQSEKELEAMAKKFQAIREGAAPESANKP